MSRCKGPEAGENPANHPGSWSLPFEALSACEPSSLVTGWKCEFDSHVCRLGFWVSTWLLTFTWAAFDKTAVSVFAND